jgi:hypothetical protein
MMKSRKLSKKEMTVPGPGGDFIEFVAYDEEPRAETLHPFLREDLKGIESVPRSVGAKDRCVFVTNKSAWL